MHYRIIQHLDYYFRVWREASEQPVSLQKISMAQKQQNAIQLKENFKELQSIANLGNRLVAKHRLLQTMRSMLGNMLGLNAQQLDVIFSTESMHAAVQFIQQAREYDADLSMASVYQAARNVWAMTGLQYLFHQPVELTPSIFAYSLLYPYTDNYLDDPEISADIKGAFNDRFGKRINGERVTPRNDYECRVFDLIGMIEKQWDRKTYPMIYESLIAIHIAQIKSLRLLKAGKNSNVDVCGISLEKGGASVVADGYLVAGQLSKEQEIFLFGYGAFLQLLDDLQDIECDRQHGQSSLFADPASAKELERLTNKTFGFGQKVMDTLDGLKLNGRTETMKSLMSGTANCMLIDAVGRSRQCYSKAYVDHMEAASALPFSFITEQRKGIAGNPQMLSKFLQLFAGQEDASNFQTLQKEHELAEII